jgi:hypothetical protein
VSTVTVTPSAPARGARTLEVRKSVIPMRIQPTARVQGTTRHLQGKEPHREESTRGELMASRNSLRTRCAECPTRSRLANIAGPSSDKGGVPHRFGIAYHANTSEFRTPDISQRGSPPFASPVALRSLPPPPTPLQVGAR